MIFMKFNPDLIRDILIAVSETIVPDEDGYVHQIYPVDLVENKLSKYPRNEVLYWIHQLMDSEILIKGSKYVDEPMAHIKDLSISGYQFVETTSKSSIWEEIRPQLIGVAISNLPNFIQRAIEFGNSIISQCTNIHF